MENRTVIPEFINLFRQTLGTSEFQAVINLFPQAVLLVDSRTNQIQMGNFAALELLGYSFSDLSTRPLNSIFSEIKPDSIHNFASQSIPVSRAITQSGRPISVALKFAPLSENGHWHLITIEKIIDLKQIAFDQSILEKRFESIQLFLDSIELDTFKQAVKMILMGGAKLTGASQLALYKSTNFKSAFTLYEQFGDGKLEYPPNIEGHEVTELNTPKKWRPGNRIISTLHKNAIAANIQHVVTHPVNCENENTYLLVIAHQFPHIPSELLDSTKMIVNALITAHYHFEKIKQLKTDAQGQHQVSQLNNILKESVSDGIILVSPDLTILEINNKAEETMGYFSNEVKDLPLEDFLIGTSSLIPTLRKTLQREESIDLGDVRLHRRDGENILTHLRARSYFHEGKLESVAIFITDLHDHEEMRITTEKLSQQALLGELSAIFAHEVRNPINNMSTSLQILKYRYPADDPLQDSITDLLQDCERLDHLMDSTLTFAKSHELNMHEVDIRELIEKYLNRIRPRLAQANIQLIPDLAPHTPPIWGDDRALERVFINITNNAIKVLKDQGGGILGITVAPKGQTGDLNSVQIDISDNGPGIPEDAIKRIFQPFYTTSEEGTGLGLAITQRIVNAHNGKISVNSVPGGTVFQLSFPRAPL